MNAHNKKFGLKSIIKITGLTLVTLFIMTIVFLLVTPYPRYADCFRNLQEIEAYAKNSTELVPMDTDNTLKPEFNKYYQKFIQTYSKTAHEKFEWLLSKLRLKRQPLWSISGFKNLLEQATKIHEAKGFKGNIIAKIDAHETSKFVAFGNIQGAFHSLTRDLLKLKELGIIDDTLKIIKPDYYMIFNCDVIDRSPYTLESLTVVLKLIVTNPDRVIYIRGHHEEGNYWQEHTLKAELLVRATVVSKEPIPLEKEVNEFFSTLPFALYISMPPNNNHDFVRISRFGFGEDPLLEEAKYTEFLQKKSSEALSSYGIKDQASEDPNVEEKIKIRVLIKAEKKRQEFQAMEGLRLLPPDKGVTSWTLLSCPTVVYATVLKFFHDAFVIMSAGKTIEDWEITLYSRDRRENKPFETKCYNFVEGTKDGKPVGEEAGQKEEKKETGKVKASEKQEPVKQELVKAEKSKKEEKTSEEKIKAVEKSVAQALEKEGAQKSGEQQIPIMIITPPNVVVEQVTIPVPEQKTQEQAKITIVTTSEQKPVEKKPVTEKPKAQVIPTPAVQQVSPEQPDQQAQQETTDQSLAYFGPTMDYVEEGSDEDDETAQQIAQQMVSQPIEMMSQSR